MLTPAKGGVWWVLSQDLEQLWQHTSPSDSKGNLDKMLMKHGET